MRQDGFVANRPLASEWGAVSSSAPEVSPGRALPQHFMEAECTSDESLP